MSQSPELGGGQGFNFEALAGAYYLTALLCDETSPALNDAITKQVALQQSAFGEPLDDLIIDGEYNTGKQLRVSLQVKRKLTVSSAKTNKDFREIIQNSWLTLKKENFREDIDRYGSVVGTISDASFRNTCRVCELARDSINSETFFKRFEGNGNEGKSHLKIIESIREILDEFENKKLSNNDLYKF